MLRRSSTECRTGPARAVRALIPGRMVRVFPLLIGFLSLLWFLVRVIPKPSRAAYPCQRAAFPLASAFVLWSAGLVASTAAGVRARRAWRRSRPLVALPLIALALFILTASFSLPSLPVMAGLNRARAALLPTEVTPLTRLPDPDSLTVAPSAVVGAVKSAQAFAEDIEFAEITSMVNAAIRLAGGWEGLIADGDTVVIKPNLIACHDFTAAGDTLSPEVNGIVPDRRVIQATIDAVREVNPTGAVFLLEGSGVGYTDQNMAVLGWDQLTGLDDIICLEQQGEWWDTTSVYLRRVTLPPGKALYLAAHNRYWLNRLYHDADVVISLPVLKNHMCSGITGGVKNVGIGATPTTIYGCGPDYPYLNERSCRIQHGASFSARTQLHNWIHDFYMCRPVDFVIMDGLQGIENGPLCHEELNGTQHISEDQMNARLVLASRDAIAIDAIASLLCGHDPALIRHLVTLHNDSLGCCDPRLIRVDGILVGTEKQAYEINDSGSYSQYSDFTPPLFTVDSWCIQDHQLHLQLTVDAEVVKVEASVNGAYLNQIRLGGFEDFSLDLDTLEVGPDPEIVVYACDRYLNHSSQSLEPETSVNGGLGTTRPMIIRPTPGRGTTTIDYHLEEPAEVELSVYDVSGRKVATLAAGRQSAGGHTAVWESGRAEAGVYFARLRVGERSLTGKILKVGT